MTDFEPSNVWQQVDDGAIMPPGLQVRMNMKGDKTFARAPLDLEPDLNDAHRFLELLDADAENFVFQVFDDSPMKDQDLGRTRFGSLGQYAEHFAERQQRGCGIFVTINRCIGGKRRAEHVDLVRAVFADLDGAPLQPVMECALEPHIVVESSPGKFHPYWLVEDVPLDQFKPIQKAIIRRFGGDKAVHDLARVMRMPGYWHQKAEPFRARIVHVAEGMPYDLAELQAEFPPGEDAPTGNGHDEDATAMADLVRAILTGENYHDALRSLAWRWLAGGQDPKDVERALQGILEASAGPRDERWQARYEDIPRAVETAKDKLTKAGILNLTDDQLALDLGKDWEPDSRYCAEWGKWIFWHGDRWEVDRTKLHLTRTRAWMRAKENAILAARPSLHARARELRDDKKIYAVDKLATTNAELVCTSDQWDTDPMLLGGPRTIDLRTGEDREPAPTDYLLKRVACAPAPAGTPAPIWARFLAEITDGDRELQAYMQRLAGYFLTGSTIEHVFGFGYGTGANGKSTYVESLRGIMGDYSTTIGSEVLMWSHVDRHPTELAKLRGVRLAVASEIERGKVWAESKIKTLTGGDQIQARFMRQDFFTFTPQFKLMVIGNHKPSLRAVDEAIKRRMHLLPFTVTIPPAKRDKTLGDKLKVEWPAILRWMIDGCLAWQRQSLNAPKTVLLATEDYLASEDSFSLWLDTCATRDPQAWEPSADLWSSWRTWADNAGEVAGSQKAFANLLGEHGFMPHRMPSGRGYYGAKLHTTVERERQQRGKV
jgi:putative DNA primase/helicase